MILININTHSKKLRGVTNVRMDTVTKYYEGTKVRTNTMKIDHVNKVRVIYSYILILRTLTRSAFLSICDTFEVRIVSDTQFTLSTYKSQRLVYIYTK